MEVRIELAYDQPEEVVHLFTEYFDSIVAEGQEVVNCLSAQHYDEEMRRLNEKYGLPKGRFYLAYLEKDVVGCIALRQIDDNYCEVKRLYVRPGYRGKQIGKHLVEQIISDAKEIGYQHIRLDTFPFMKSAIALYDQYGFYEIEKYNDNPANTAVFMQLDL